MTRNEAMQRGYTTSMAEAIGIYVLGPSIDPPDPVIGQHGSTAMCASVGYDYALTEWPIVVKVKPSVSRVELVRHLLDLAAAIEQHVLFIGPETIRTHTPQLRGGFRSVSTRDAEEESADGDSASTGRWPIGETAMTFTELKAFLETMPDSTPIDHVSVVVQAYDRASHTATASHFTLDAGQVHNGELLLIADVVEDLIDPDGGCDDVEAFEAMLEELTNES